MTSERSDNQRTNLPSRDRRNSALARSPSLYAEHVLESAGITVPPVGVSDAARFVRGITIREETLLKDGYLIDFGDGEAEIIVNARAPRHRARFTAAHELGHWILRMETD